MITLAGGLPPEKELENLREAYDSLKDVIRGIDSALSSMESLNFGLARDHLKAAKWHIGEAQKKITAVGKNRSQKG